jgi:DNA-binding transcriptional regulator YdaS (Cro superfamily)
MKLNDYLKTLTEPERQTVAKACRTSVGYLRLVAGGHRDCREKLATMLERATNGIVTRKDLRPDDWAEIWPELKKGKAA